MSDALPFTVRKEGSLAGLASRCFDLRWSPTQRALASVGEKGGCIWSVDNAAERVIFAGTELMRVCWHPDGARVLTGDAQGKVVVRSAADGQSLAKLETSTDEVYGLEMLSSDGLLAAGAGDTIQLWDLTRAQRTAQASFEAYEHGVIFGGPNRNPEAKAYLFGMAARGRVLSTALSDGSVRLLDSQTLKQLTVLVAHARRGSPVFATAFSPTTPTLASSDGQGTVLLWDLRQTSKGPLAESRAGGGEAVHSLAFVSGAADRSAELLVAAGGDKCVRVHETGSLATVGEARVLSPVLCADAAPGAASPRFATSGGSGGLVSDATVSLWRVEPKDGPATTGRAEKRQRSDGQGSQEPGDGSAKAVCLLCRPAS